MEKYNSFNLPPRTFDEILSSTLPLTEEILNKLSTLTVHSGYNLKIGDKLLFGFLQLDEANFKLIKFTEQEINNYKFITNDGIPKIQYLK